MLHFFTITIGAGALLIAAHFLASIWELKLMTRFPHWKQGILWRIGLSIIFVVLAVGFFYAEVQNIKSDAITDVGKRVLSGTPNDAPMTTAAPLSGDSDGDGIPDLIDDYPWDATQW